MSNDSLFLEHPIGKMLPTLGGEIIYHIIYIIPDGNSPAGFPVNLVRIFVVCD